jgi:excisionase family DNA binding protein
MRLNRSMPQLLVSIDDAARALSLSKHTIIKWVKTGVIPSVKVGSRRLIIFAELERIANEGLTLDRR